jgi:hypothetical protein
LMNKDELIEELRLSYEKEGPYRRVIRTQFGVAAGNNRLLANPNWPSVFKQVNNYIEHLKIMYHDNLHEMKSEAWWRELINSAAAEYAKQGVQPGEIGRKLHVEFGMSETKIRRYLDEKFKEPQKVEAAKAPKIAEQIRQEAGIQPSKRQQLTKSEVTKRAYTDLHVALLTKLSTLVPVLSEREIKIGEEEGGVQKTYVVDNLIRTRPVRLPKGKDNKKRLLMGFIVEVEGEGSASKDNKERDEDLAGEGYIVIHVPNQLVENAGPGELSELMAQFIKPFL